MFINLKFLHDVMVLLSKNFYSSSVIKNTIEAYRDVCFVNVIEKPDYYHIFFKLKNNSDNLRTIELEFCNYCLSLLQRSN
jgi:hypothetical protein